MRRLSIVFALGASLALSGCDRVQALWLSPAEKVNRAYPPSAEVRIAEERLRQWLAADGAELGTLTDQLDARLTLRALTCTKERAIGRMDTVEQLRAQSLDLQCFRQQDAELLRLLGLRTIGVKLAQPPLRPLAPLGPPATIAARMEQVVSLVAASQAGVGVLRGARGELTAIELPGARQIATLGPISSSYGHNDGSLSPNGRVVAYGQPASGTVAFVDVEGGAKLWESEGAARMLAWLPAASGILMSTRDGQLMLGDLQAGTLDTHPTGLRSRQWATPVNERQVLVAGQRELELLEHARGPNGLTAATVRQYRLPADAMGGGVSSAPTLMRGGTHVVFNAQRAIGWLDLQSREQGAITVTPLFDGRHAKIDETHLLIESTGAEPGSAGKTWVLDIQAETVAPADADAMGNGQITELHGRRGFMRRGSQLWVGDSVPAGEAKPIAKLVGDFNLQMQLAKLEAQNKGWGTDLPIARGMAASGLATPMTPAMPGLADLPADAQIHIVGVYEGERRPTQSYLRGEGDARMRDIRVMVRASSRPVILVLASYEPVRWNVENHGRLAAVLLSGYHASTVTGVGTVRQIRIGRNHAYNGGGDYAALRRDILQYTGMRELRSFQGGYTGKEFTVGP